MRPVPNLKKRASGWFTRDVPLDLIRHNNLSVHNREGYGGQPITAWPIYGFVKAYADGLEEAAGREFAAWYKDQLSKYQDVPGPLGGMHEGSLYRLIDATHHASGLELCGSLQNAREEIVTRCIEQRVEQRLSLVDEIRRDGYVLQQASRVMAVKSRGRVYLKGGHHRAAILKALGYQAFPRLVVLPRSLFALVRRLKERRP